MLFYLILHVLQLHGIYLSESGFYWKEHRQERIRWKPQTSSEKYRNYFLIKSGRSPEDLEEGATRPPGGRGARPTPWPRRGPAWPLWPTSGAPLRWYTPSWPKNHEDGLRIIFPPPLRGRKQRERKALRQGEICRGNFPSGGANHSHRHRHRSKLHRDHHLHHLHR